MTHDLCAGRRLRPRQGLLALALLLLSAAPARAQIAPKYRLVELGNLGQRSFAYHVNERGEVVGIFYKNANQADDQHAFVYRDGRMVDLFPNDRSVATDINDSGVIAGWGFSTSPYKGWVYANGRREAIQPPAADQSYASGINNAGTVVGYMSTGGPYTHAYQYKNGHAVDLGVPPGAFGTWATDVNDAGTVVGIAHGGSNYPVMYKDRAWTSLAPQYDLGGWAAGVNASGQVAGYVYSRANNAFVRQAFRYADGALTLLGDRLADSIAGDINGRGMIVGSFGPEANRHAFVDDNGRFVDLNTLLEPGTGWVLRHAEGINDAGNIVGYGRSRNGSERAFMLVPVPEPACVAVVAPAALLLLRRRGSSRR